MSAKETPKPDACPDCRFSPVAEIIYGEVRVSDALALRMKDGDAVLGGCFVIEDAPTWRCTACGKEGRASP